MKVQGWKLWGVGLGLFGIAQTFFLIHIHCPQSLNFDEFHYVPSAKQYLAGQENQNWEHPPLGKLLIASGIQLFGDQPLGWRFSSTFFGALSLVAVYALAFSFFGQLGAALWTTLITLFNQLVYVQARIGMLDTSMTCFLLWAIFGFFQKNKAWQFFTGIMLGLAVSVKWYGLVLWLTLFLMQCFRVFFTARGQRMKEGALLFGSFLIVPLFIYLLCFIPYFQTSAHSFREFLSIQKKMYDGQLRVVSEHPYMSQFWQWPLLHRPIWYAFERDGLGGARGVLLLGNPLIMWGGLLALLYCAYQSIFHRKKTPFFICLFYLVLYGSWIFIPRKIAFYYYYYPASFFLSFALAYFFKVDPPAWIKKEQWLEWAFLGSTIGLFIYFFPILGALRIPAELFRNWMWFESWI